MLEDYSNASYQLDTLQSELSEIPENERYPEDDDMIQEIVHLGRLLRANKAKCRQGLLDIVLEMKAKLKL